MFILAGNGLWDKGTKLVPRNGIASGDWFDQSVSLFGYRALIGAVGSDEKGKRSSGAAFIFHRVNGVWQEESKLVLINGEINYWFGYDVALSRDTAIIGSLGDGDMGPDSGSVYVFFRQDGMVLWLASTATEDHCYMPVAWHI